LLSVAKEATLNEQWIKPCVPFYLKWKKKNIINIDKRGKGPRGGGVSKCA
jgi:hypothetical protein